MIVPFGTISDNVIVLPESVYDDFCCVAPLILTTVALILYGVCDKTNVCPVPLAVNVSTLVTIAAVAGGVATAVLEMAVTRPSAPTVITGMEEVLP